MMKPKITFVSILSMVLVGCLTVPIQGRPNFATTHNNRCTDCHTNRVTGRMEVTAEDSLTDLGTQLDGNVRGPLKSFKVISGHVVTLSVRVIDGNDRFAVQLKDLEMSARQNDTNNMLVWSAANEANNTWTRQQASNPPYFTKDNGSNGGIAGSLSPITYTFALLVESDTPPDVYELVFAVPGVRSGQRVYQEEHFYLEVISPIHVDFNGDGVIDGGDVSRLIENWQTDNKRFDIAPATSGDGIVDVLDLIDLSEHLFQEVDDPTLAAHWALDEEEGDIAVDSVDESGFSDGQVIGDPVWQPLGGQVNGAIQLDGVDDVISINPVLNPGYGPFSVLVWIKGGAAGQTIFSQSSGENWLLTDPSEGLLMTELRAAGRGGAALLSETSIIDGDWHRIGFVWDGSNRILYVDSIAVAQDNQLNLESSSNGLYIGTNNAMETGTFWNGLIDDVRIYNRVVNP